MDDLGHELLGLLEAGLRLVVVAQSVVPGEVGGVVGERVPQRPGLQRGQPLGRDPAGRHGQHVVEPARHPARRRTPAGAPLPAGAPVAVRVGVAGAHVVVLATPAGVVGDRLGVERPVRQVRALHRLRLADLLEAARGEPAALDPDAQCVPRACPVQSEREHRLGGDLVVVHRIGHQIGAAELAGPRQRVAVRTGAAARAAVLVPGQGTDARLGHEGVEGELAYRPGGRGDALLGAAVRAAQDGGAGSERHARAAALAGAGGGLGG